VSHTVLESPSERIVSTPAIVPPHLPLGRIKAHSGTITLLIGIFSLLLCGLGIPLGIVAIVMAMITQRQIISGAVPESELGKALIGKKCGVVAIVINVAMLILSVLILYKAPALNT
jgi:hypothetical protein